MKSIIAAAALSTLVAAQKQTPFVPVDAQVGLIKFPLNCTFTAVGAKTLSTSFTATAPNYGTSGQQIYYDEVISSIVIPGSVTSIASSVNATQASALIKIQLNLENATPAQLAVFPNGLLLQNISITPGQPATVRVPKTGNLSPIGPVTLGTAGIDHIIHLGAVNATINLQDSTGKQKLGPLAMDCGAQPVTFSLGVVNVGASNGAGPFQPVAGGTNTYPSTVVNQETGFFRYPYSCNFGTTVGTQSVDLTVGGSGPTYIAPSASFSVADAQAFLNIPAAANAAAKKAYPNLASYKFTVNQFNLKLTNASPATLNVLATPITVTTPYNANGFVIALPQSGTLTAGPITAGTAGKNALLSLGTSSASLTYLDSSGNTIATTTVSCTTVKAADIFAIPVTTSKPFPISS